MTQHALLLTRESEEDTASPTFSSNAQDDEEGILITLTLDAAQVSAVVSAVQSEEATSDTQEDAGTSTLVTTKDFVPHTDIKLANPKSTTRKASTASFTRHSVSLTESIATSATNPESESPIKTTSPASASRTIDNEDPATDTRVFVPSSGGIKAVITSRSSSLVSMTDENTSSVWIPSTASTAADESPSQAGSSAVPNQSRAPSGGANSASSAISASSAASAPSSSAASSSSQATVTVTTTASARTSTRSTSTSTRVFVSSIVAKPVITNSNGVVVTVMETTGTAFVTASGPQNPGPAPTATATAEKKNFFQTIDSSPTAIALTTIVSAVILALIALAVWCCMKRRVRTSKRRDSLFDFAPDARDVKSASSVYSEKTPIVAAAYPFSGEQASFGYDTRQVDTATAPPAVNPRDLPYAPHQQEATTSAVRFAGIYPNLSPERRKSSVDLGLLYRLQPGQSPRPFDNLSTMADTHSVNPSSIPVIQVQASSASPPLPQLQETWGQAHDESPLAVPPRPARPASLSGSITKKIEEMYNPTPRSSFSILPPVPRPWVRQARKWASMSSMGGGVGAGPDRRPSVDRRLYQQQLPSRFSITTFATSVEASPDLGVFRPRRTAITEQHLGGTMLRTDIFKTVDGTASDSNPFGDHARVAPSRMQALDNPSPMSISEPWASTSPLVLQNSSSPHEVVSDSTVPAESLSEGHDTQETSVEVSSGELQQEQPEQSQGDEEEDGSMESLETASEASAIGEEEEENIRALIKRRQSASSAAKAL